MAFSLVSVFTWWSFYKDTSHSGLGVHPTPVWLHLNWLYLEWPYVEIKSHSEVVLIRTSTYLSEETNATCHREDIVFSSRGKQKNNLLRLGSESFACHRLRKSWEKWLGEGGSSGHQTGERGSSWHSRWQDWWKCEAWGVSMRDQTRLRFEGSHGDLGRVVSENRTLQAGTLGKEGAFGCCCQVS